MSSRAWGCCLAVLGLASGPAVAAAGAAGERWTVQTEPVFQHLTTDHGLPDDIATTVVEDGSGFLWIGGYSGLARWDGYRLRVYTADPATPGALPDNIAHTLHGDAAGRLWVGTSSSGLLRHDPHTDQFVRHPVGPGGLSHVTVRAIADDGPHGLWIGTDAGLDHLDTRTGTFTRAGLPADAEGAVSPPISGRVRAIAQGPGGTLWAGGTAGLFRAEPGAPGGRRFERVPLANGEVQVMSLAADRAGRVWVGTAQHGAFVIEPGAPARPVREFAPPDGRDRIAGQPVEALIEAVPGEMWVGLLGQGVVAVDLARGVSRRIRHVPTWPSSLPDNAVRHLYRDRAGLVWVASNRGVSRHDPRQSAVLTRFGSLQEQDPNGVRLHIDVSWVQPMADGRIWLGTHAHGVEILDTSGARVGALRPDPRRPETALPESVVMGMAQAADGRVFIATRRGVYQASADGHRVRRLVLDGRSPAAPTWSLQVVGDALWLGGEADGLWRLDLRTGRVDTPARGANPGLSDPRIVMLAPAADGGLWVGTRFGLNHLNTATGAVRQLLPDGSPLGLSNGWVASVHMDAAQRLWVGLYGAGIDLLSFGPGGEVRQVQRLNTRTGLPADTVNALLPDHQGRVWVSTDDGLALIEPDSLAVRLLRRADGVVFPTYWMGAAARTPEGELLFGGAGGITIARPDRLQRWEYQPPVVVSELRVGGKRVPADPYLQRVGETPARHARPPRLEVPPDANSLTVEFAAIDFSAPQRNRYAYQLEGFDRGWVDTDPERRLAAYTNLPPGDYTLRLRGSNREGAWSEQVLSLPVRVLPAWHQTLWFRLAVALAVLALLAAVVQARTRWLRARRAELERKVDERTAELQALHRTLQEKSAVLQRTAITDPLTGLHNRRFLTEHIETDVAANLRRAQELRAAGATPTDTDCVFFLIDIDHFKRVNDLHGHAVGDAVLVQVAQRLRTALRESDHLVRWGGEEFLAVARDTDRARAEELAERLRAAIADAPFDVGAPAPLEVSCSIGFACLPFVPTRPQVPGWQGVVRLADDALLAAKRAGRDTWIGLHATETTAPEALPACTQPGPRSATSLGELRTTSNRPADVVARALAGDAAALPATPPAAPPPAPHPSPAAG